ncbi:alkylphosphonate utilization protein [Campylobacter canadensis]|uniref:Alkylphosphonate utilization protein n=1 Tax=Campylobacter canadensis TaxID=449520 RepID=A0ABS7WVP1_9BACT|nr:alkylphosphonate utilization protein [Campylobacter canadensis]MBZ7988040.1 alkylphosphonate utilization protein [Campylobacter canadensis]MBZ7995473.1 alkylphosphonate utilization protein [Campylobacter canadensis]MBZ7997279.1 alkylphosphonate utilization protein [Campylobacter canadensis]MBZ7999004.1 alkylphosphonate utilization protein [Campylobacter canadensis]MBZ8000807.1 alkylphosphonate utilization protein [Campylobacter canadensis]
MKDSNNTPLQAGDNVTIIKDLKVKGASNPLKRGTLVKNIKEGKSENELEAKIPGFGVIVIKTEFVKKA